MYLGLLSLCLIALHITRTKIWGITTLIIIIQCLNSVFSCPCRCNQCCQPQSDWWLTGQKVVKRPEALYILWDLLHLWPECGESLPGRWEGWNWLDRKYNPYDGHDDGLELVSPCLSFDWQDISWKFLLLSKFWNFENVNLGKWHVWLYFDIPSWNNYSTDILLGKPKGHINVSPLYISDQWFLVWFWRKHQRISSEMFLSPFFTIVITTTCVYWTRVEWCA